MTTIINATDPAEFLSLVPALAGFTPRDSLVMLPFRGTRTQGAMRIDLPDAEVDPDEYGDLALRALLQVHGVDAVALVVYTDVEPQQIPDGLLLPQLRTVEAVAGVCADAGLRIVDAFCVTPSGWADYIDEDPEIRPLILEPVAVPGIGDLTGDQLTGATLPPSDLVTRERVGRALDDLETEMSRREHGDRFVHADDNPLALLTAELVLDDLPGFAEHLLDAPSELSEFECAALLWCLGRPPLRDSMLVQWATDEDFGSRALDAQLSFSADHTPIPDAVGEIFLGRGPRPDPDRLGCALQAVRTAASRAPRQAKVGALTAAAWLAWALGRSSHAGAYVDEALHIDPEHSMASLIASVLAAAMLPEWVLRRGAERVT